MKKKRTKSIESIEKQKRSLALTLQRKKEALIHPTTKLNLGCRDELQDGFDNIDLYHEAPGIIKMDVKYLKYPDNSINEIVAHSILEHLTYDEGRQALREWARVLTLEGTLSLITPDLRSIGAWITRTKFLEAVGQMYGMKEQGQGHKSIWWHELLEEELEKVGLVVDGWDTWMDDIKLKARKVR